LGQTACRALANHRRAVIVEDLQQWIDHVVGAEEREALDGPVADVLVGVVDGAHDDFEGSLRLDAAVAQQRDVPQRVGARALCAFARVGLEAVQGRRTPRQPAGRHVDLDRRRAHAHVVRVDCRPACVNRCT
jgi:hypothetical protein